MFGNTGSGSAFGSGSTFGSSSFGQQNPANTTTQPGAFGAGTAFGGNNAAGTSAFGAPAANTSTGVSWGAGNSAFGGNTQNTTGSSTWGGSNTGFGSTSTSGNWGNNTAGGSAFGAASKSTFGSGGSTFGATAAPSSGFGFGASNPSTTAATTSSTFGSATPGAGSSVFGQKPATSAFGAAPQQASPFGAATTATTAGGFGAAAQPGANSGTLTPAFSATADRSASTGTTEYLQNISAMTAYQAFSPEELRVQDYLAGRKPGAAPTTNTATTGGFGQPATSSAFGGGGSAFGNAASTPSGFGSTATNSAFGSAPGSTFGASSGSGFGTSGGGFGSTGGSGFGANTAGGFGATATSAAPTTGFGGSTFGASSTTQPSSGFGGFGAGNQNTLATSTFGAPNTANPTPGFGAGFGTSTSAAPATSGTSAFGGFGGTAQTSAAGTGFGFGSAANKPATSTGFGGFGGSSTGPGFGATTGTTSTGFGAGTTGGFGANTTSTGSTGLFGQPAATATSAAPAAGSLFGSGASTAPKPFGATSTGTFGGTGLTGAQPGAAATNTFGKPAAPSFGGTGSSFGFGGTSTSAAQPSTGLFGAATPAASTGMSFGAGSTLGASGLFATPQANAGGMGAPQGTGLKATIDQSPYGKNPLFTVASGAHLAATPLKPATARQIATPTSASKKLPMTPQLRMTPRTSSRLKLRGFAAPSPLSVASSPFQSSFASGSGSGFNSPAPAGRTGLDDLNGSFSPEAFVPRQSVKKLVVRRSLGPGTVPLTPSGQTTAVASGQVTPGPAGAAGRRTMPSNASPLASLATPSRTRHSLGSLATPVPSHRVATTPKTPRVSFDPNLETAAATPGGSFLSSLTGARSPAAGRHASLEAEGSYDLEDSSFLGHRSGHHSYYDGPEGSAAQDALLDEAEYWTKPSLDHLHQMDATALAKVENFKCGLAGVGQVNFIKPVDLTTVDSVDEIPGNIIIFDQMRCTVYPDESIKPPRGQGLNVPAIITLEGCWPIDKETREPIIDRDHPRVARHMRKLRKVPETSFIDFVPETGTWTFKVEHFSQYGLDADDDDEENENGPASGLDRTPDMGARRAHAKDSPLYYTPGEHLRQPRSLDSTPPIRSSARPHLKPAIALTPQPQGGARKQLNITRPVVGPAGAFKPPHYGPAMRSLHLSQGTPREPSRAHRPLAAQAPLSLPLHPPNSAFQPLPGSAVPHQSPTGLTPEAGVIAESLDSPSPIITRQGFSRPQPSLKRDRIDSPNTPMDSPGLAGQSADLLDSMLHVSSTPAPTMGTQDRAPGHRLPTPRTEWLGVKSQVPPALRDTQSLLSAMDRSLALDPTVRTDVEGHPLKLAPVPFKSSLLHGRTGLVADAGLMLGRSFRVGWGPHGILAVAGMNLSRSVDAGSPTGSYVSLQRPTIWSNQPAAMEPRALVAQCHTSLLQAQLEHTTIATDDQGVPYARLQPTLQFQHFARATRAIASSPLHPNEAQLWKLGSALWDPLESLGAHTESLESSALARVENLQCRSRFYRWLRESVAPQVRQHLQAALNDRRWADAIFHLLTGHQLTLASRLASQVRNHRLATLLAQVGDNPALQTDVQEQLVEWHKLGVTSFLTPAYRRVYEMLSGNVGVSSPDTEQPDASAFHVCAGLDWKRALAAHIWYGELGASEEWPVAIHAYKEGFNQPPGFGLDAHSVAAPRPWYTLTTDRHSVRLPLWVQPQVQGEFDTLFHLMALYADPSYALTQVLSPLGYAPSSADYRLAWHLYNMLARVCQVANFADGAWAADPLSKGDSIATSALADELCASFAAQLESVGLWQWAAYVLLFVYDSDARRAGLTEVLNRYLPLYATPADPEAYAFSTVLPTSTAVHHTDASTGPLAGDLAILEASGPSLPVEQFLVDTLRIPSAWLHQAHAVYSQYREQPLAAACHWVRADEPQQAHYLLLRYLAPPAVLTNQCTGLMLLLQRLEPAYPALWTTGGQLYRDYLEIMETFPALLHRMSTQTSQPGVVVTRQPLPDPFAADSSAPGDEPEDLEQALAALRVKIQTVLKALPALAFPPLPLTTVPQSPSTRAHLAYKVCRSEMAVRLTLLIQHIDAYLNSGGTLLTTDLFYPPAHTRHPLAQTPARLMATPARHRARHAGSQPSFALPTTWTRLPIPEDQRLARLHRLSYDYFNAVVKSLHA
ncbi:hypothetical protein H4R34_000226 [Dimargaris verticillata]|uniref:Peptidase S59 domain-containing protein n=1 Tax=Dimargaris verticillata TaxID=2761393 RepID=A0A9W8B5R7_9FUNG|nr:hypothetical protein H4R34_000226 [Dimargaris verticillata]